MGPDVGVCVTVGVTPGVPGGGEDVIVGVPKGVGVPKVGVVVTVPIAAVAVRVVRGIVVGVRVERRVGVATAVVPGSRVAVGCSVTGVGDGSGPAGVRLGPNIVFRATLPAP
jgi:hypothetical protein